MYVLKNKNGEITDKYIYLGLRHIVNPDANTENLNITIGHKVNTPDGYWILSKLPLSQEELHNIMLINPPTTNTNIREMIANTVYSLAKEKGLIPKEAIDDVFLQ